LFQVPEFCDVIINAFLQWAETAKSSDRARAADALGRAYLTSDMQLDERNAAMMAMTFLLDDPSPHVRLSLAKVLAGSKDAPRAIILSLAEDQPEISGTVILHSPVLDDADLVDLSSRGTAETRVFIASRKHVSRAVSAAIAEIGGMTEVQTLLENPGASFSSVTLFKIANRLGDRHEIRNLLVERADLPAAGRLALIEKVGQALVSFQLAQEVVGTRRIERIARQAFDSATVTMAGEASKAEIPEFVEHLCRSGTLTPAFLMHALCTGKVDFFAHSIVVLSGLDEKRVRSILADGGTLAIGALYQTSGLGADIADMFVQATLMWRKAARETRSGVMQSVSDTLMKAFGQHRKTYDVSHDLLEMVEKLHISEQRQVAREYAAQPHVLAA
jgi:uncharacterized protein (DUF2336 family)